MMLTSSCALQADCCFLEGRRSLTGGTVWVCRRWSSSATRAASRPLGESLPCLWCSDVRRCCRLLLDSPWPDLPSPSPSHQASQLPESGLLSHQQAHGSVCIQTYCSTAPRARHSLSILGYSSPPRLLHGHSAPSLEQHNTVCVLHHVHKFYGKYSTASAGQPRRPEDARIWEHRLRQRIASCPRPCPTGSCTTTEGTRDTEGGKDDTEGVAWS